MKKVFTLFYLFILLFIAYSDNKDNKIYMNMIKNDMGTMRAYYYYDKYNRPYRNFYWGSVWNQLATTTSKYYYFKSNKYIENRNEDFDMALIVIENGYDFSTLEKIKNDPDYFKRIEGVVLKYSGDSINYIGRFRGIKPRKIKNIDFNEMKIEDIAIINDEGYPENMYSEFDRYLLGFYSGIPKNAWKGKHEYIHEYYDNKFSYDGRKQIKKLKRKDEDGTEDLVDIYYDNKGRIEEIRKDFKNGSCISYNFYYKKNILYIIELNNLLSRNINKSISIRFNKYNKFGYCYLFDGDLQRYISNIEDKLMPFFDDMEKIKDELKKINTDFNIGYKDYYYMKTKKGTYNEKKIAPLYLEQKDLTDYFLGISEWFRYKYLNDITDD